MYRTIIVAVIAVILFSATANAQSTTITAEINNDGHYNVAALYTQGNFFTFAQTCEGGWSQAYAGASYSSKAGDLSYELALGAGAETQGFRYGGWVWTGLGKASFIHFFEGSGSGPWHRTILKYAVTPKLSVGVTDRAFYGRGMRAEYKLGRTTKLIGEVYDSGSSTAALSSSF